jgi:hypothetical protein
MDSVLPSTSVFPCQYYSTDAPQLSLSNYLLVIIRRTNGQSLEIFAEIGEHWLEEYFNLFVLCESRAQAEETVGHRTYNKCSTTRC